MTEFRWHPFREEWVANASHRQERTYKPPPGFCPLCPTRDPRHPTEIDSADFDVAAFDNRFPSMDMNALEPESPSSGVFQKKSGLGVCEVVVYSPSHSLGIADMDAGRVEKIVHAWKDRFEDLSALRPIRYVYIFENRGDAVGVTLHHPHGQIYAFPFVPPFVKRKCAAARRRFKKCGVDAWREIVEAELKEGVRTVWKGRHFIAFVPFYARFPFETHILPRTPVPSLTGMTPAQLREFAVCLRDVYAAYDRLFNESMPLMMAQFPAPSDGREHPEWRFHVEFYPLLRTKGKLKFMAGCETGAGMFITDMSPEAMAERMAGAVREVRREKR